MPRFTEATRASARARIALFGPSGSGKTYTGLLLAEVLGDKIAVIDTEHGSASKYAGEFTFFHWALAAPYSPQRYVEALIDAHKEGYDVVLVDGLTHAWDGAGGVKDIVDKAAARMGGNSWAGWSVGTPEHNKLIEAMLACPIHVIATMRAKTEWVIEEASNGRKVPKKLGLGPMQRDGIEYEFDISMLLDVENNATVTKSRMFDLPPGTFVEKPGQELAQQISKWLTEGSEPAAQSPGEKEPSAERGSKDKGEKPSPKARETKATAGSEHLATKATRERVDMLIDLLEMAAPDHPTLEGKSWRERMGDRSQEWFEKPVDKLTEQEMGEMATKLEATAEKLAVAKT